MAKFAPNYLKTLLHMYRARELGANVMSAAKEFVKMATPQKAQEFFDVAKDKALNEQDENLKPLYWDIVILLAPWLALGTGSQMLPWIILP